MIRPRCISRQRFGTLLTHIRKKKCPTYTTLSTPTKSEKLRHFSTLPTPSSPSTPALTSSDGVTAIPINFDTASRIEGQESQIAIIDILPGQVLRAESGAMIYMTEGVSMNTTTGGGIATGIKRAMTGQNVFISDYTYDGPSVGQVALGTDFPSKIIRLNMDENDGKIVAQRGAVLAYSHTVDIEMEFVKKLTAGFFGGEGFILQGLTGVGDVFLKAGGMLIRRELSEGEELRVSSGSLVAMQRSVEFEVGMMPGIKNIIFGGEGLFVTTLRGPGVVWLQGMPPERMIAEIVSRVPSGSGLGIPIGMGMGGGGGGGGEEAASDAADPGVAAAASGMESNDNDESGLEGLASDDAIQADRNATIASSGIMDDPNSPSSLFGDAAPPEDASSSAPELDVDPPPDYVEHVGQVHDTFEQDRTTFDSDFDMDESEQYDDTFDNDGTTFSSEGNSGIEDEDDGGGGTSVFDSFMDWITDTFNDDD